MRDLTSLDLKFLVSELKILKGGRIQKIYQRGKNLWFEIFISGKGTRYLYFSPGKIFLSDTKIPAPKNPESFAMLLRKYLSGQKIVDISQPGFERILDIETEHYILHLEIFSKSNAVLCDKAGIIIQPLEKQHWKDRNIYPSKPYLYPPKILNPFEMNIQEYKSSFEGKKKQIVIFLAIRMGLSGIYAEEICARAGVDKTKSCEELTEEEIVRLRDAVLSLKLKPILINSEPYPIEMKTLGEGKPIKSFLEALDKVYLPDMFPESRVDKTQERILLSQKMFVEKWKGRESELRKKAEILKRNYGVVDNILRGLKEARDRGLSWDEIKQKVFKDPELSKFIKEIREKEGKVILNLTTEIEVDLRKTARENLEYYFNSYKKAKQKLKSTEVAILHTKKRMKEELPETIKPVKFSLKNKKQLPSRWFEKLRWTFSRDGFLIVGGRDATQNEIIFKKYIEPWDIILHADVPGAPLTVIKSEGREVPLETLKEAAQFAGVYSSAWKRGIGTVEVYWVRPEQVTKSPKAGEYLPKGSFVINGKRNYLRAMMRISIGVKDGKIFAGTEESVRELCGHGVTITPGTTSKLELAKKIKLMLLKLTNDESIMDINLFEFERTIPSGKGDILKSW